MTYGCFPMYINTFIFEKKKIKHAFDLLYDKHVYNKM